MTAAVALQLPPSVAATQACCAHCGATAPAGARFCCGGCEAAYAIVRELDLDSYYLRRTLDPSRPPPRPDKVDVIEPAAYAEACGDNQYRIELAVHGLHCAACVWLVESVLGREPEVIRARLNATTGRLSLAWTGRREVADRLARRIAALGYRVAPIAADDARAIGDETAGLLRAMLVAGFAAANVMLLSVAVWAGAAGEMGAATRDLLHWISAAIALPALLYAGRPFARSAWSAIRAGHANMDVPITIGITLTALVSLHETALGGAHAYFESATMLVFFLLVGRYLDRRVRGRARSGVAHFLALSRVPAQVIRADGRLETVTPAALSTGDRMQVASGDRLPADGVLVSEATLIDTSLLTGEAMPRTVRRGALLHAGTVNLGPPIAVEVTAKGERTLVAEIARLVAEAEGGRAAYRMLADRVARRYAPTVHAIAAASFIGWIALAGADWRDAMLVAAAVLIITCPCALALAVPASGLVAASRLARAGTLLKSPTALERLAEIDTIVFDKTGTLTRGRPTLIRDGIADADLAAAAAIAAVSRHPLSRAVVEAASTVNPRTDVTEHPGLGLEAGAVRLGSRAFCGIDDRADAVGPELWLARPDHPPVRFRFEDPLRSDAVETVRRLQASGYRLALLSGDRPATVRHVAAELGIEDWAAGLTPAGKAARIAALAQHGARVLMIGDGLNDAPALAAAHASLAPALASDATSGAADAVFQGERLGAVVSLLDTARAAHRIARQNLLFALAYNAVAVPLAVAGGVTPLIAALAMSSSSMVVVGNALRLDRRRPA
ncbi:heavy metal translocating P-type ATPase [Desertibaculum subflavum]|uniref:heavy metal translocating P-type ATPase n=1 Tax=Desertibaculum subflavum TaxID=2268458 RepID=UPI000E67568A